MHDPARNRMAARQDTVPVQNGDALTCRDEEHLVGSRAELARLCQLGVQLCRRPITGRGRRGDLVYAHAALAWLFVLIRTVTKKPRWSFCGRPRSGSDAMGPLTARHGAVSHEVGARRCAGETLAFPPGASALGPCFISPTLPL